ncbi:TIGR00730 family Rossman fold protein [Catenulispora pinisilvae]|uniref:LOG family protein n=1 Tax=Catenulispora pinisilvae TaxID=2705253 RepID=UPI0018925484|nr:TIGR00730 family Rossman fold protein [Catenulispora pinisilvae]
MQRICVFSGSSHGRGEQYLDQARQVGTVLARRGITVVYGGARVGTMGSLADGALEAGGQVVGVIPRALVDWDVAHQGLSELHVAEDLHQRKAMMAEQADAFIALPGGSGTLEELFEIWTWGQLGLHAKPVGLLNVAEYFTPLVGFLDHMTREGFLHQPHRDMLLIEKDLETLLDRFAGYQPPDYAWRENPTESTD